MPMAIYPSLINADLLNLAQVIRDLEPYCAGYHLDIMDNHCVPNLTWGHQFANAIAQATSKRIWVHLLVDDPKSIVRRLVLPDQSLVCFHVETKQKKEELLSVINENNWSASIAISPKTSVTELIPFLPFVDQVLLMSVEPGHSGQQFMPATLARIRELKLFLQEHNPSCRIGVDGGVGMACMPALVHEGVHDVAIASAIFDSPDYVGALKKLRR